MTRRYPKSGAILLPLSPVRTEPVITHIRSNHRGREKKTAFFSIPNLTVVTTGPKLPETPPTSPQHLRTQLGTQLEVSVPTFIELSPISPMKGRIMDLAEGFVVNPNLFDHIDESVILVSGTVNPETKQQFELDLPNLVAALAKCQSFVVSVVLLESPPHKLALPCYWIICSTLEGAKEALGSSGIKERIEVHGGAIDFSVGGSRNPYNPHYYDKVPIGSSIGVRGIEPTNSEGRDKAGSFTIGAYVSNLNGEQFAVTCAHPLFPPGATEPLSLSTAVTLVSPSDWDHAFEKDQRIHEIEEFEARKTMYKGFDVGGRLNHLITESTNRLEELQTRTQEMRVYGSATRGELKIVEVASVASWLDLSAVNVRTGRQGESEFVSHIQSTGRMPVVGHVPLQAGMTVMNAGGRTSFPTNREVLGVLSAVNLGPAGNGSMTREWVCYGADDMSGDSGVAWVEVGRAAPYAVAGLQFASTVVEASSKFIASYDGSAIRRGALCGCNIACLQPASRILEWLGENFGSEWEFMT